MNYDELTKQQKLIADKIERIYINSNGMNKQDFITGLAFVLNKHKHKTSCVKR